MTYSEKNNTRKNQYIIDALNAEDYVRLAGIMEEFKEGFSLLSGLGPLVTIFGSARSKEGSEVYEQAERLGRKLAKVGRGVLTGGGPGIMEAANKGAHDAGGVSIGVAIDLPDEQIVNKYLTHSFTMEHFFVRKFMLVKYASAFVMFPGGYGTLDELFESLNLIKTKRSSPFPVILFGSAFWKGIHQWLATEVLEAGNIGQEDLDLITVCDDLDEVVRICKESVNNFSG